jgi:hypothetical protein
MLRDRETQIQQEQKKSQDLQKDRKFLFEKQQSQSTELLTVQDDYTNYKANPPPLKGVFMCVCVGADIWWWVVGSGSNDTHATKGEFNDEGSMGRDRRTGC